MTKSRRFHRSYSLWAPKAPVLLDLAPGDGYDPLEGAEPAWGPGEDRGSRTPRKEESSGAQRGPRAQGRWAQRAASLRAGKASRKKEEGHEEATGLPTATQGDAVAHSVVPSGDDGQLLLAEDWDRAGGRMRKCKKQVHRALRRGWETFVTNVYSLTLSSPARPAAAGPLPSPQVGTR